MRFPFLLLTAAAALAAEPITPPPGNRLLGDYFAREVAEIEAQPLAIPGTLAEWDTQKAAMRRQLAEMLGLSPMPERTPLNVTKTNEQTLDGGVIVENLHYQSMPGLYVTANFYRPVKVEG